MLSVHPAKLTHVELQYAISDFKLLGAADMVGQCTLLVPRLNHRISASTPRIDQKLARGRIRARKEGA